MESAYRPASGIRRLLCGTQPILSMRALKAALDVLDGVDLAPDPRQEPGADRPVHGSRRADLPRISAPASSRRATDARAAARWRSRIEHAYAVVQALIARGVIGDFRAPDIMRFGFAPLYLRYRDVFDAADGVARRAGTARPGAIRKFAARATVT